MRVRLKWYRAHLNAFLRQGFCQRSDSNMPGKLLILEGPDGSGKTTLAGAIVSALQLQGTDVRAEAFPGNAAGSLGQLVYRMHHDGGFQLGPNALQALHVAAHVDTLE